jgi:hypothetical protein
MRCHLRDAAKSQSQAEKAVIPAQALFYAHIFATFFKSLIFFR